MSNREELTHVDERGQVHMVDISDKEPSFRRASASAELRMGEAAVRALDQANNRKGDALATARIAGIQAAKQTSSLIPLCHQVAISGCKVEFGKPRSSGDHYTMEIRAEVRASDATGVEMEALTAVSVAGLTLYDMLKAVDRGIVINAIQLEHKEGGRRGTYTRGN